MANVICVSNQKGGVGKTTTAGALIAGLSNEGYRVLGIDLDPQGNLSASVGAEMYEAPTVYDLMKNMADVKDAIQTIKTFDIISSNVMLAGAEQELSQIGKEHRLKEVIYPVIEKYDFIVIDTPPSLGVLTVNALTLANDVIIPTTAGIFAANGIRQLHSTIMGVKKYYNPEMNIAGILLTKYNARVNISKQILELTEKLGAFIDAPIYDTRIRAAVAVEEAQANQLDIFRYSGKSAVAEDYKNFVIEYINKKGGR